MVDRHDGDILNPGEIVQSGLTSLGCRCLVPGKPNSFSYDTVVTCTNTVLQ